MSLERDRILKYVDCAWSQTCNPSFPLNFIYSLNKYLFKTWRPILWAGYGGHRIPALEEPVFQWDWQTQQCHDCSNRGMLGAHRHTEAWNTWSPTFSSSLSVGSGGPFAAGKSSETMITNDAYTLASKLLSPPLPSHGFLMCKVGVRAVPRKRVVVRIKWGGVVPACGKAS